MSDIINEIDEFVANNGVGAHFEYTEKGRKIKDEKGNFKIVIDNINTLTRLAELLAKASVFFIRKTRFSGVSMDDLESYYYEAIYDIAPHYQNTYGSSFCGFFLRELDGKFMDMYKKDRIYVKDTDRRRKSDTDKNENDSGHYESIFTGYTITDENKNEIERKELGINEEGYSEVEQRGKVCEIALQIVKMMNSLKNTKQYMSRLFFTDDVIFWIEGEDDIHNLKIKHAREVFENMDKGLIDYLMVEDTHNLIDILNSDRKTLFQLYVFLDEFINDTDILSEYKAKFNPDKLDKGEKLQAPKLPLGNNMFLAYLYAADCINLKDTNEKPVMHDSSYITKYQNTYKEILKAVMNI